MAVMIKKIGVIGSGQMGNGIAHVSALAGLDVVLNDVSADRLKSAMATINGNLSRQVAKKAITDDARKQALEHIAVSETMDGLADCDLVIETAVEKEDVKRKIFHEVCALLKPRAIVASNTSGIPMIVLTEGRGAPFRRRFLGTHFFAPPRYMHLLEIIPGPDTDPAVIDAVRAFGERLLGKGIVLCKDAPGFVANRLGVYGMVHTIHLMERVGLTIDEVDALTGPLLGRPKSATFRTADLSGVRAAIIGGAPTPPGLLDTYRARGLVLRPSWGMTELAPSATYLPTPCLTTQPGAVGIPLPYARIRLVSPETGDDVRDPGLPGELWVAGPQVTPGYWQDEEATRAALTPDGWLRSGDLAMRDADGCLTLVGRCTEAINTGGEKVVPGEVEKSLAGLGGVSDVVVVGAPDPAWGETVVAVLECDGTVAPTLAEVRELAARTIARFKLPTRVLCVAGLPRTATGKVDRCAVKALAAAGTEV